MRLFFLFFFSWILSGDVFGQRNGYCDSIVTLVLQGDIRAYDSYYKPISLKRFKAKYYPTYYDTVVNDVWSRPMYVNNIYFEFMDGELHYRRFPFDTANSKNYISFVSQHMNRKTGFQEEWVEFRIKKVKNVLIRSKSLIEYDRIRRNKAMNSQYALLINKRSWWQNSSATSRGMTLKTDSCFSNYRLKLNSDMSFMQNFGDSIQCYTKEMFNDVLVGLEGNVDLDSVNKYAGIVRGYYINVPNGIWTIDHKHLVFKTMAGKEMYKFKILHLDSKRVLLEYDNRYTVELRKVFS